MAKVSMVVKFELPDGASVNDAVTYVGDAVSTWAGSLRPPGGYNDDDPGDPFFLLDRDSVVVTVIKGE